MAIAYYWTYIGYMLIWAARISVLLFVSIKVIKIPTHNISACKKEKKAYTNDVRSCALGFKLRALLRITNHIVITQVCKLSAVLLTSNNDNWLTQVSTYDCTNFELLTSYKSYYSTLISWMTWIVQLRIVQPKLHAVFDCPKYIDLL